MRRRGHWETGCVSKFGPHRLQGKMEFLALLTRRSQTKSRTSLTRTNCRRNLFCPRTMSFRNLSQRKSCLSLSQTSRCWILKTNCCLRMKILIPSCLLPSRRRRRRPYASIGRCRASRRSRAVGAVGRVM